MELTFSVIVVLGGTSISLFVLPASATLLFPPLRAPWPILRLVSRSRTDKNLFTVIAAVRLPGAGPPVVMVFIFSPRKSITGTRHDTARLTSTQHFYMLNGWHSSSESCHSSSHAVSVARFERFARPQSLKNSPSSDSCGARLQ